MNKILSLRLPKHDERTLRLGERLRLDGIVSPDQIQIALHEQRQSNERLGEVLVRMGFVDDATLAKTLAEHTGHELCDLKTAQIDPELLVRLPLDVAERCRMLPLSFDGAVLRLAVADPLDIGAIDEVRRYFPHPVEIVQLIAPETEIAAALEAQTQNDSFDSILRELEGIVHDVARDNEAWKHPVVRLVNTVLNDAVRAGASDIHLEPESNFVRVRFRIDGVLRQKHAIHMSHWGPLSHRLKLMAGMNIADQRNMQDGRFDMTTTGGAKIDFRMAVMPTVQGENIVIRILDRRRAVLPLESLGYSPQTLAQIDRILKRPEGIVLVTGPTGSGKTTTLYAMLKRLSSVDINIMTLEEPVEYQFEMIRQTAIHDQQGWGFAEGVRGILRQAPDIIFIGEVRDDDTARMSLRAAMTGHQVFTTLHCNDSFGALPRLNDLGLSSRMMAENLIGIVAQRLVRKLCPHCKRTRAATSGEMEILGGMAPVSAAALGFAEAQTPIDAQVTVAEAVGCPACDHTGYQGRTAVTEVLRVTPALDDLIAADATRSALRKQAEKEGFVSMASDGIAKVLALETSVDELRRNVDLTRIS